MASAAFTKALLRKDNAKDLAKQVREAKAGGFTLPHIDNGKYIARVKASCGISPNKNIPFVEFKWNVVANEDGTDTPFKDKGSNSSFYLEDEDQEREANNWKYLGKALKVLSSRPDIDNFDMQDLETIIDEINAEAPFVRVQLTKWQMKNGETVTKEGYRCYFNEKVDVVEEQQG